MEQPDLWGVTPKPTPSADATRIEPCCWDHCRHCSPDYKTHKKKVYRRCSSVGTMCYHDTKVCKWVVWLDEAFPLKPQTPGWDDF